jgi:predicted DNA-binding transcriptional regulator AlpA
MQQQNTAIQQGAAPSPSLPLAWSTADVASALGISKRKVMELVGQDGFPHPRKLGARTFRWSPEAITLWLSSAKDDRPRRAAVPRGRQLVERV